MEKEMTNEMFSHLKKIYRIVIFSFCLNVVCMMVLIWKLFIAQPDYTAFFSGLQNLFEHIHQTEMQDSYGPLAPTPDMPAAEREAASAALQAEKELYEFSRKR